MHVRLRRLWIQLTADRRRFGALCAMLVVGLLLWARLIVTTDLPRTAIAEEAAPRGGPRAAGRAADNRQRPARRVRLDETPHRDPLVISDLHFPRPTRPAPLDQDDPKSAGQAVDDHGQADRRRTQQLWQLVSRLRLDGVMQGRPMAVINGRTCRLEDEIRASGDEATAFRLVEVGHRSVVLECEGRRFTLSMDHPGSQER